MLLLLRQLLRSQLFEPPMPLAFAAERPRTTSLPFFQEPQKGVHPQLACNNGQRIGVRVENASENI